jgi:hypothetical protein
VTSAAFVFESSKYLQLRARVSGFGGLERDGDEVLAQDAVEYAVAPAPVVVVRRLVDDIPMVALAGVVTHHVGDVRLYDLSQRRRRPCATGHPVGQLGVPDSRQLDGRALRRTRRHHGLLPRQRMAAQDLPIGLCNVGNLE